MFKTSNLFHAIYNFSENRINASDCRAIRKWKEKFSACNLWCAITAKPNCTWNSFQIFSRFYIIGNEIAGFGIMKSMVTHIKNPAWDDSLNWVMIIDTLFCKIYKTGNCIGGNIRVKLNLNNTAV